MLFGIAFEFSNERGGLEERELSQPSWKRLLLLLALALALTAFILALLRPGRVQGTGR